MSAQTMQLHELLPADHIVAPLEATTLRAALGEMLAQLDEAGALLDPAALERALNAPRGPGVVAAGEDVVLPHFRTDAVDRLIVALGISPQGLDGRDMGMEGQPRIIALILAPTQAASLYLQAVSVLARWLRDGDVVRRLASADAAQARQLAVEAALRLQPRLTVRDIMVQGVRSVSAGTSVREAVDVMVRHRMRALPVVGEKQEVLGVISERDVMRGLLPQIPRAGQEGTASIVPETLRVKDVMTRSVLCITEDLSIEEAANMMINKDVEQFPVTSDGRLTGFVSRGDVIRKLFGR
ncbi:MAG TPA: CBS domain-containing protein [Longimicrobiales bacterium]|nr:CBS domain-containing protein [Longimicrobiales bacterium]